MAQPGMPYRRGGYHTKESSVFADLIDGGRELDRIESLFTWSLQQNLTREHVLHNNKNQQLVQTNNYCPYKTFGWKEDWRQIVDNIKHFSKEIWN